LRRRHRPHRRANARPGRVRRTGPHDRKAELTQEIGTITPRVIFVQGLAGIPGLIVRQAQADPSSRWRATIYPVYGSSKAALNMLTIRYAAAFPKMRISSVDPGFTATDFNQHRGTQTVEEGAQVIVRYALIAVDGPTGASSTGTVPNPGEPRGSPPSTCTAT